MNLRGTAHSVDEMVYCARELRKILWADPHRPRYHLLAPEGFHNDANGMLYWNGRYHVFLLARTPIPDPESPETDAWIGRVWDHASSHDLVHWVFHRPALESPADGSTHRGPQSGDAVENAPTPTLIYHWGGSGTHVATSVDDDLERWTPSPHNPVIPLPDSGAEYVVFDPCAWYQDGTYYALIGNRNQRPGYDGDCTSLFRSDDMLRWEYRGPFYRSNRDWTEEIEDCACPDFFPLGNRHVLLMHGHRPYQQCHYYVGEYRGERFYPASHGRMTWPGGQLAGPETLLDDRGRRIFMGWIPEVGADGPRDWHVRGWASVMSLPRVLRLTPDGRLGASPVQELQSLRTNHRSRHGVRLKSEQLWLDDVRGDSLELLIEIRPEDADEIGLSVRCSDDGQEETSIVYVRSANVLQIRLERSTLDEKIRYPVAAQEAPLDLARQETLTLQVFLDRSVLEVFANDGLCLTQRIYPARSDSNGVKLLATNGSATLVSLDAWDMRPVASW